MSKLPAKVRKEVETLVWTQADAASWSRLTDQQKSRQYDKWVADPSVGGVLSQFMDQKIIRVYLKDSLIKSYSLERTKQLPASLSALEVQADHKFKKEWIKPHGRILADNRCICWGPANDWKSIILSVVERALGYPGATPFAAVFVGPLGKMAQASERKVPELIAQKLGIKKIVWDDVVRDL